ncbi:S-layer homology domain-containing protein [Paenibacillus sp. V4I5]|uniref:S-layer homology domain-containing protein n=1 Tax=Paenibacillus sp. V4I5 TaxID=3042306 RepID=UPI0027929845|nr:S-layer homology domain-containing protein [Paenibacillus sp. V4I5]MDQ0920340.1 uncharacterized protein YjdB [Paenibacillus sp. V4I5]
MLKAKRWLSAVLTFVLMASVLIIPTETAQAAPETTMDAGAAPAAIYPYDQSTRYAASANFTLKANGVPIPVIKAYNDYDYAHFSMSGGPVTYEVTILNTDKVHEYAISPKKLGIKADSVVGRTLTITTQKDEYLIITMNNRTTRLVIAADPAETDIPASSGEGIYNITEAPYHLTTTGVQTGVTERTAAIQKAIDDASNYGTVRGNNAQGVVYVPAGTYYIGNLILKSNTAIYMQPGATFVGTGKTADYTEHWFKNSMGRPATWWISTAFNSQNIKIYGRGTIDGNGKSLHDDKSTNNKGMINNLVVPIATSNFTMDGVIIRESAGWAVMPVRSNDLVFTNLKMFNSLGMGENDGIDIVESQNAIVRNSIGIALDDPYSTKAWKEDTDIASGKVPWPGNPEPVSNVLIEDSITWTLCYGYKIGQGVMQNQDNITFRDGVVYKAAVGFAIHHKYGVGTVSNVTFENIDVEDISGKNEDNSAWMTMFTVNHNNNGAGPITGVTVKDITVRDAGESFAKIKGQEGALITGITFENVYMPGSSKPATTLHEMNFTDRAFYSGVTIKPVQAQEPRPRTNLALKQTAVGSSSDGSVDTASWAFDGNLTTRFGSKRGVDPGWLYVDLGESKRINEVRLYWEAAYGKSYQIQVSDDAENWTHVFSTTSGKGALETIAFNEVNAHYVRMYGTVRATQYGYSIWEFEVYGPEVLADSITLDKSKLDMLTGMTEQLTAALLPENTTNKKAFWTTSNPNVASVNSSGLVTATGPGTATITATTSNGELIATAAVTVTGIGTPGLHAAMAGDGQVSLSWGAVEGATSYQIFSRDTAGSYGAALATVNSSTNGYKAEGLINGTTYFFVIKAVYPGGESAASNEVSATPQVAPIMDFVAPEDANIHYMGRWDRSASATYKSYWPGASLRVSFTGTNVQIKLGASANLYAKLDDAPYVLYKNATGTIHLTPTPLPARTHTLTVVSKDILDVLSFQGLLLDSGATTVQAAPRDHLIEFIGDSITVGYTTPEVSIGSYAWLAGEQLGADHTQIAYTGICLETGVACYVPNSLGMSEQYFKLQPGDYPDSPDWNFSTYQPDAIVINLGTNDAKFNVSDNNFQSTYTAFLQQIRTKYPSAQLFVLRTFGDFKAVPTLAAVNSRIAAGDTQLHYLDTTGWVDTYPSSDFNDSLHPSSAGHVKIANRLAQVIRPYLDPIEPPIEAPELQDIPDKKAGDTVTITGRTELSTLTIKVLRPDQSILYINVLKGGNFSDSFTLPNDAMIGTYTIVAGSGDVRTVKRFEVIEDRGSEVLVTEISLNPTNYTMAVGSQVQFIATVLPVQATNKTVTWSVYNETGLAQIDQQGSLTAIQAGIVTVKAAAKDGSGIVGTSLVTITRSDDGGDNTSSNNGGNSNNLLPSVTPVTPVMKDGMAFVQLDEKQTSALVSMLDIQERAMQVNVGGAAVTIDQTELKYLLSKAGTTEGAMVQVKVEPVVDNVSQAQQGTALLKVSGLIYEIKVSLLTKDNREIKVEQLRGSVEISLPFDTKNTDPLLLGVYYYNEQMNQWEFVGGNMNPDTASITVKLKHLSKYAAIEYRKSFDDVDKNHWVARTLEVLSAKHIISGKTDSLFVPDDKTTRAEFTAMLIRALGLSVNANGNAIASPFKDVGNNDWFAGAVQAAYGAGLVSGVTDTEFAPHTAITREQMAIMLVKAYEIKHGKISLKEKPLHSFEDGTDVSEWAVEAVNKALTVKLMQGVKDGGFDPQSQATRAQNAQAIYNLAFEEE